MLEVCHHSVMSLLLSLPLQTIKYTIIENERLRRGHAVLWLTRTPEGESGWGDYTAGE